MLASGKQTKADNRAGWALSYLSQSTLISPAEKRGFWKISDAGSEYLKRAPEHIKPSDLQEFEGFREFKKREKGADDSYSVLESDKTPHEQIESAYRVSNDSLASDLLSRMTQMSPKRFELLIISLMLRLGYGRGEEDAGFHVGQSGDEGIDGIISEDKLGLDKIYLQAKRWKNGSVGRPDVQAFVGALSAQRAIKGVFITTASFTREARDFAESNPTFKLSLIDGRELARLMIAYNLGVSLERRYDVKRVDSDFFIDD